MVDIKGIGQHTIKEKTSFQQLLNLLSNVNTFLNGENYKMANTNLQMIDDGFPTEKKTDEYVKNLKILEESWRQRQKSLLEEITNPTDYLRMDDAKVELQMVFNSYVIQKYQIIMELFTKNKFFENEPREYMP